ncbi:MAG: NAD(P)H-dependent oxidoreductase subunit E [Verrucomicrobia bacterium]|nr:NAD(P)H-dependent oxidoreductase subunit E [Verrucomicrobiota bacterium]
MALLSNSDIIEHWKSAAAPLLPVLHAFHDRDGHLSEDALRAVSDGLGIPIAELFGSVTFYHHFAREAGGRDAPRVCTGNICALRGAHELLDALRSEGATPMPCAGRCDQPIPVLRGDKVFVGLTADSLAHGPTPLPPRYPGDGEECVFSAIREPGRATLPGYRNSGGYEGLEKLIKSGSPGETIELVNESKLAGRGGAGFPTGRKWQAVADAEGESKFIVCNADEGEPGCFKDRAIMDHDPHAVLEGMIIAGYACGAGQGFIYLRYEYPETFAGLERAIADADAAGLLGENILGSGFSFRIDVRRGAGAYICGEEGSLLNSLEGKHPFPRNRPPFPVTHGYNQQPTAVNNVETLASVPHIARRGAAWYCALGIGDQAGTKLISLSGDIERPGNYEVPLGLPLQTLLNDWAGGAPHGREIQAVTMAGLSGGFLAGADLNVTLDEPSIRSCGSFLGAGGVIVFDDSRDMVKAARDAMEFFAHESCGKCFPCRIGTQRLTERLAGEAGPASLADWKTEVEDIGSTMRATSACGLGVAAPMITDSLMKYFPDKVEKHVQT